MFAHFPWIYPGNFTFIRWIIHTKMPYKQGKWKKKCWYFNLEFSGDVCSHLLNISKKFQPIRINSTEITGPQTFQVDQPPFPSKYFNRVASCPQNQYMKNNLHDELSAQFHDMWSQFDVKRIEMLAFKNIACNNNINKFRRANKILLIRIYSLNGVFRGFNDVFNHLIELKIQ